MDAKDIPCFTIGKEDRVNWPVIVTLPVDGGEFSKFKFMATILRMPEDKLNELQDKFPAQGLDEKNKSEILQENARKFSEMIVGWSGVKDAAGKEVEFTPQLLREQILGVNGLALSVAIWTAINEVRYGARLGN